MGGGGVKNKQKKNSTLPGRYLCTLSSNTPASFFNVITSADEQLKSTTVANKKPGKFYDWKIWPGLKR